MRSEKIILRNRLAIKLDEVREKFSQDIYQTDLHYDVCEFVSSQQACMGDIEQKILMNLYALKSPRIKNITSLVYFLQNYGDQINGIDVHDDVIKVLERFNVPLPVTRSLGPYSGNYIRFRHAAIAMQKAIANRLFRLFTKRLSDNNKDILRGWVEVTAAMYPELMSNVNVRLYPFPHGFLRQLRFYLKCRKNGVRVSFAGLPYSFFKSFRSLFSFSQRDLNIVSMEKDAYRKYAQELLDEGVTGVYTSDEFEVAAVALYEALHQSGVNVVNTAHGVGLYCPNVNYSQFWGISLSQASFYQRRCASLRPAIRERKNTSLPLEECLKTFSRKPALVLIDQNFRDFGCLAEAVALESIKRAIESYSISTGVSFFIKLHPNSRSMRKRGNNVGEALYITDWLDLIEYRPIFIAINSTAFYDVKGYGPMLVYSGESFFPDVYFGSALKTFDLNDLESKLDLLMDSDRWLEAAIEHKEN